jgi:hypothetical protein
MQVCDFNIYIYIYIYIKIPYINFKTKIKIDERLKLKKIAKFYMDIYIIVIRLDLITNL